MKKTITLSLLTSLFTANVHAQTIQLEEVTVEAANRTGQNIKDITESITVITSEEIEETRVRTLGEALSRLSNIALVSNGGLGKTSSFLTRGMDSKRTLVLIDGIRYNNVTFGIQYQHIMLNNVDRIEIIKGAQSGIWGADASAGVINIITKKAQNGTHTQASLEAGSFNTQQGSVELSHKTGDFDIITSISRIKTDGFSVAEPNQGTPDYGKRGDELGYEEDAYTNNTYNIKLGYDLTKQDRVVASYQRIDAFTEYDGSMYDFATGDYQTADAHNYDNLGFGTSAYFEQTDNRFYSAAYKHKDALNDVTLQYSYSYFNNKTSKYKGNVQETSLQDRIAYMENSFLRVGGSYQRFEHEAVDTNSTADRQYNGKAVYVSNYNKFDLFSSLGTTILTESLRYDNFNAFENTTTGKIGIKQFVHTDIYISSNYGNAYNIPSLSQLYGQFGANPNLEPEKTKSADITIGNDEFSLTYFYNKVDNLIDYDFTFGYQNISGVSRFKGVEVSYSDDFFDLFSLNMGYTYLDAKNAEGEFLRSRPKHQIDANIVYYVSQALNIGLNGQYIGERYDNDDRQGAQTGKYAVYNAVINYTINDNFAVYGKIDNIGNKYYQVRDGYATAERSFYAGVDASF